MIMSIESRKTHGQISYLLSKKALKNVSIEGTYHNKDNETNLNLTLQ